MTQKTYIPNIPAPLKKRLVIVGGGFAGLKLVQKSLCRDFQIVLLDKNNYHQFQPLLYQVATAGLEPSAISFPLRKVLQKEENIHFRVAEVLEILPETNEVKTNIGYLKYDFLVLATGADTNFFGQEIIERNALPMKSASDAILIRNTILENFEKALLQETPGEMEKYLNIALVGGGPTGVELAGALAEMKKYIFPKDYPELDLSKMRIVLFESSNLLAAMSAHASELSEKYLERMGVEVKTGIRVTGYDGTVATLSDGSTFETKTLVWAAGIKANLIAGLPKATIARGGRLLVDRYNLTKGYPNIFAIGDLALMETPKYPNGHPQVAQTAIQQAKLLAKNMKRLAAGKELLPFEYTNKGSLATIGRNRAVADLPGFKLRGFVAWALWSIVHLFTIMGVKNRFFVFLNWSWNYFTYDQSLRLLIKPKAPYKPNEVEVSQDRAESNINKKIAASKIISTLTPN
ncbi:MAG: NAD(P)/FAD-dependent oxidoreductase [Lentimicrobium sp.]|nr:NAD(P)/FAD-dependent oxidoreductase [Lentimicrobium sp.]